MIVFGSGTVSAFSIGNCHRLHGGGGAKGVWRFTERAVAATAATRYASWNMVRGAVQIEKAR